MSTLTDLIVEALAEHPDATDRSADDGCWCREPNTAGRYAEHAASVVAGVVADWLESVEVAAFLTEVFLRGVRTGHLNGEVMATALAAEARKGADQ